MDCLAPAFGVTRSGRGHVLDLGASCHFVISADAWVDKCTGDFSCDNSGAVFARRAGAWRDPPRAVVDRGCGRRRALHFVLLVTAISHALLALVPLLPFGTLASGAIVVLAEPDIGWVLALRMPFVVVATGSSAMFFYGLFWLKIDQK